MAEEEKTRYCRGRKLKGREGKGIGLRNTVSTAESEAELHAMPVYEKFLSFFISIFIFRESNFLFHTTRHVDVKSIIQTLKQARSIRREPKRPSSESNPRLFGFSEHRTLAKCVHFPLSVSIFDEMGIHVCVCAQVREVKRSPRHSECESPLRKTGNYLRWCESEINKTVGLHSTKPNQVTFRFLFRYGVLGDVRC